MLKKTIDINADVGEGLGNENKIMPLISSCNIACGGHAGDESTMATTIALAHQYNVKIGAHPSYPDRENFGRKPLEISSQELIKSLEEQLDVFKNVLYAQNGTLHHIKPHGALYNRAAADSNVAKVIVNLLKGQDTPVKLYAPYGSVIEELARKSGVEIVYEAFADRNYNKDLTLVSRQNEHATITKPNDVLRHCLSILSEGKVKCLDGTMVPIKAGTLCVHGDNKNAQAILKLLNCEFQIRGIEVR